MNTKERRFNSEMIESINQKCIFDFFNLKVETQMPLEIRQEEEQKIRLIQVPAAPSPNPTTSAIFLAGQKSSHKLLIKSSAIFSKTLSL